MNLERIFSKYQDHSLLLVRIAFGIRLIWGTQDNILSMERMQEFARFLETNDFPFPMISAFTSVYLQFAAGLCWILGVWVRTSSLIMALNFIVAILMVHLGDAYINTAPAIHLLVVSTYLLCFGPGKFTLSRLKN